MTAVDFFTGQPNTDGRTLDQILALSDADLERHHDIIQWCFPLHEPSPVNPDAPVITPDEHQLLSTDPATRARMLATLTRWLAFYGFEFRHNQLLPAANFAEQSKRWNHPHNHNHLRITRIIRSLRLFGLEHEARQTHNAFLTFAHSPASRINPTTPAYWSAALTGQLFAPIAASVAHGHG